MWGKKLKNIATSVVTIYTVVGVVLQQVVEQVNALPDDAGILPILVAAVLAMRQVSPVLKEHFGLS